MSPTHEAGFNIYGFFFRFDKIPRIKYVIVIWTLGHNQDGLFIFDYVWMMQNFGLYYDELPYNTIHIYGENF